MHLIKPRLGVASTGWKFILPLSALTVIVYILLPWAAVVPAILTAYVVYFFRDPNRKTPKIPNSICAPADGKVASILEVPCDRMPEGRAQRVSIFLNIFNVHVQRSPMKGKVVAVDYRPGKCLNALNEKCSEENEAATIWLDTAFGPVGIRQLSGAIARRIICCAKPGDELERGDRYGIIQFGSRVELFLPLSASIKVQPGQKTVGGETCMAVLFEEEVRRGVSREMISKISSDEEPVLGAKAG